MLTKVEFPKRSSELSNDLWIYLPDIIGDECPSRKDRDVLEKLAHYDPSFVVRLKIWDFFFKIDESKVGVEQKDLIEKWKKCKYEDIPNAQRETLNEAHQRALDREKEAINFTNEIRKKEWLILIVSGILCLVIGIIALLYPNDYFRSSFANSLVFSLLLLSSLLLISILGLSRVLDSLKDVQAIFKTSIKWVMLLIISGILMFIIVENGFSFTIPIQLIAIIISFASFVVFFSTAFKTSESKIILLNFIDKINKDKIAEFSRIKQEGRMCLDICDKEIFFLESQIRELKNQVPRSITPNHVHQLFQISLKELRAKSKDLCGFERKSSQSNQSRKLLEFDTNPPEPLLILAPIKFSASEIDRGAVQGVTASHDDSLKILPYPIDTRSKTEIRKDGEKHIAAYKEILIDGVNNSFAAVYSIKFVLFSEDLVCVYSCYYDFITNKVMKETTTETYFKDIVSLITRQTHKEISLDDSDTAISRALTVVVNKSSGSDETIELADIEFIAGIKKLQKTSLDLHGIPSWVNESEKILRKVEKILRQQIRFHKNKAIYRPS